MSDTQTNNSAVEEELPPPTLWQVAKSVLSAAFGVQKREILERDFQRGKASHFIIIGIVFTFLFVLFVWGLVSGVMSLAGV